jgi:2-polyprenyl-6-hydroxyphenyl methylase/3-demethylubiquinone-9 3-methyltransferase
MANLVEYERGGSYWRGGIAPHHKHIVPAIVRMLPQCPLRILDIGCGTGFIDDSLAKLGHEVVGIDFDPKAIEIHRCVYPRLDARLRGAEDALKGIFAEGADLVLAVEVVEHLYRPMRFLLEAREALRPGGHLLLTTPYHGYWKNLAVSVLGRWDHVFTVEWEEGHIKFFSEMTMRRMLASAGFDDVVFGNAGRVPYLWRTMVVRARRMNAN